MNRLTTDTSTKAIALAIFTVAAFLLVTPATASAQRTCWDCHLDIEDENLHWDTWGFYEVSPPDWKHENLGEDACDEAHTFMCETDDPEAIELLVGAVSAQDIEGIVAAYSRLPGRAVLNQDRRAFQITSCKDPSIVVAHLSIDESSFEAIALSVAAADAFAELASQNHRP